MALSERIMSLSGVEFELLCHTLLSKLGFSVEMTKTSGDGGIDLVAYNSAPLVKGKYIVQCKRYSGSVGVQIIRDLYGVVTAERANKGILITTGYFTVSAIAFAEDKNIELIDAEKLSILLDENGLDKESSAIQGVFFQRNPHFDLDKFEYYKSLIVRNLCTKDIAHDFILKFLFEYMENPHAKPNGSSYEMIRNGLCEEYFRLFDWYEKKYFQKGEYELKIIPYYVRKYKGLAQLYNFDLFDYVQSRYSVLKNGPWYEMWTKSEKERGKYYKINEIPEELYSKIIEAVVKEEWSNVKYSCGYSYYEIINLLSLFQYFSIEKGVRYIDRKLSGDLVDRHLMQKKMIAHKAPYYREAKNSLIFFSPSITSFIGKRSGVSIKTKHETLVPIKEYFDKYIESQREKINDEIRRINVLLDTLN